MPQPRVYSSIGDYLTHMGSISERRRRELSEEKEREDATRQKYINIINNALWADSQPDTTSRQSQIDSPRATEGVKEREREKEKVNGE